MQRLTKNISTDEAHGKSTALNTAVKEEPPPMSLGVGMRTAPLMYLSYCKAMPAVVGHRSCTSA